MTGGIVAPLQSWERSIQGVVCSRYYRHYKGNVYRVLDFAVDTTTGGWLVVYENPMDADMCTFENTLYARPVDEWFQVIDQSGNSRFVEVETKHG